MLINWLNGLERGKDGVLALVDRALELRSGVKPERFDGARIAAVFLNPSLRTKTSMDRTRCTHGVFGTGQNLLGLGMP